MIAKAIDKLLEISAPAMIHTDNGDYANLNTMTLKRIPVEMKAQPIEVTTLGAFVKYITDIAFQMDTAYLQRYFVHVESPTCVRFISALNGDRERECLIVAKPILPKIPFESFIETEKMIIILQANFQKDAETDLETVKKFVGTVTAGTVKDYSDNGVSQQATIKSGPRGKENAEVPSPCWLRPVRTFTEVSQPASEFIFRLKEQGDTVYAGLFEADGGAWRISAMATIADYIREQLKETGVQVVA